MAAVSCSQAGRTFEPEGWSGIGNRRQRRLEPREQHGSRAVVEPRQWTEIVAVINRAVIMRMTGHTLDLIAIVMAMAVVMIMITT